MKKEEDTILGREFGKIHRYDIWLWILIAILFLYVGYCVSNLFVNNEFSMYRLENIDHLFLHPLQLRPNKQTPICLVGMGILWLMCFAFWYDRATKKYLDGQEYGTSRWGNIRQFNSEMTANCKNGKTENEGNRILSQSIRVAYDTNLTARNNNMVIIGGSGAGKTAFMLTPNLLNLYGSNVYTDPKGSLVKDYGNYLEAHGVEVQLLNLNDMDQSMRYNPFIFIRDQIDLDIMATNIFTNTAPENTGNVMGADPFWEDSAIMLLKAIMFYIWLECPRMEKKTKIISYREIPANVETGQYRKIPDETETYYERLDKDFSTLLKLTDECEVSDDNELSAMDRRILELERENPRGAAHPAVVWYRRCMKGAADTKRSILSVLYSRISRFDNPKLLRILSGNDLELKKMGTEKKIALFIVIPETDDTYNFVPGILYTQLFQQLFDAAKATEGNKLPIPVGFWLDEFANIPMPRNFDKIVATVRSYNMYTCIFLQSLSQIKTKHKNEEWEGIVGNCDTFIYLGGNEASTFDYVARQIGSFTIDKRTSGETLGSQGSSSRSYDRMERQYKADEVRMLPNSKEIVLYRSTYPLIDKKIKCWTMPEYNEAKKLGEYRTPEIKEKINLKDFFQCKGDVPEINIQQVDALTFLKTDLFSQENQIKELEFNTILQEIQDKEFQEKVKLAELEARKEEEIKKKAMEQEEQHQKNRKAYEESKGDLVNYMLSGYLSELQIRYYKKCLESGFAKEEIYKIINPSFDEDRMEKVFHMVFSLYNR